MKKVVSTDEEESNINDFALHFNFPDYYNLAMTDSAMNRLEDYLFTNRERFDIETVVTGCRRNFARVRVFLKDHEQRLWFTYGLMTFLENLHLYKPDYLSRPQAIKEIKEKFLVPADVEMHIGWSRGRGEEAVSYVSVYGEDTARLMALTDEVKKRLEAIPEALSVEKDLELSSAEVDIRFDRDQSMRFGADPGSTAWGLLALIRGVDLPKMRLDDYDVEVRAELRESDRETLAQVMNLPVASSREGSRARLEDIASVGYDRGLGEISRENRRTRIQLKVTTSKDNLKELSRSIDAALAGLNLPPGYEWDKGRRFHQVEEAGAERSQSWLLAVVCVLLLMGALFESFVLPWSVIIAVPISFFGVWWLLWATGTQFGVMAAVGVVILIGVVVNNAIVLVDRANQLRAAGMIRDEALIEASRQRFRPIMMTALTTIMGLIPMAVGDASMVGIPYAPMGRAIIGGLAAGTIATPVAVPLAYSLIEEGKEWIKNYFASFSRNN